MHTGGEIKAEGQTISLGFCSKDYVVFQRFLVFYPVAVGKGSGSEFDLFFLLVIRFPLIKNYRVGIINIQPCLVVPLVGIEIWGKLPLCCLIPAADKQ